MQLHEVRPKHRGMKAKRIGRGGKKGTYSGRGIKGQKARSGHRLQPRVRELLKRYPKLRGYRRQAHSNIAIVDLSTLEKNFVEGAVVNPHVLVMRRIVGTINGKAPMVKVLGDGEITKALTFENCTTSISAKGKIEKAGGTITRTRA